MDSLHRICLWGSTVIPTDGLKKAAVHHFPWTLVLGGGVLALCLLACLLLFLCRRRRKSPPAPGQQNPHFAAACLHHTGSRSDQQDSYGISDLTNAALFQRKGLLAVIADGMGGLQGGAEISARIIAHFLSAFSQGNQTDDAQALLAMAAGANDAINRHLASSGHRGGSTLAAAILRPGRLFFIAVGDSRLYLLREGTLTQLNRDHTLQSALDEQAIRGEIPLSEAENEPQRAALTRYIGMGHLTAWDRNLRPLPLQRGDAVLLMTDGVFHTLDETEIASLCKGVPPQEAARRVEAAILAKRKPGQDNFTAIFIACL